MIKQLIREIDPQSLEVIEPGSDIIKLKKIFHGLFDALLLQSVEPTTFPKILDGIEALFSISIKGQYTNDALVTLYCQLLETIFQQLISFDDFIFTLPDYIRARINFQLALLETLIKISSTFLEHLIHHKDENQHQHCRKVFAWVDWLLRSLASQAVHLLYGYYSTKKLLEFGVLSIV